MPTSRRKVGICFVIEFFCYGISEDQVSAKAVLIFYRFAYFLIIKKILAVSHVLHDITGMVGQFPLFEVLF